MAGNLRIYIAIATFLPLVGGAEMQALAQARSLRYRGYETTIITMRHAAAWPRSEIIEGVPVMRVAGRLLAGRERLPTPLKRLAYLLGLLVMGWTLWRMRRRYDILHVYQLNLLALPAVLACRLAHKPMIFAVRSTSTTRSEREEGGDLASLEALGRFFVRFTRSQLERTHAVVVVLSSRMQSYLTTHKFNVPGTLLIPNGVDVSRFSPPREESSLEERAGVVVCISKLRYEKGIDVLLRAWQLMQEQLPRTPGSRLIIVGDGPLQAHLKDMARDLGIDGSVEFAGLQSDIPAQLHRGSVAVLPSRWEGMPNALLEAMACGLPCVATRVSGSEDIIQPGVNGLLVEPEDPEGMAQAMLALLRDRVLAQRYGQAARETIEKNYAFEHITDIYVELYHQIAKHQHAAGEHLVASGTYRVPS